MYQVQNQSDRDWEAETFQIPSIGWSSGNQSFFFGGMLRKNDLERNASGYFIG
jgi:hypothetical protein